MLEIQLFPLCNWRDFVFSLIHELKTNLLFLLLVVMLYESLFEQKENDNELISIDLFCLNFVHIQLEDFLTEKKQNVSRRICYLDRKIDIGLCRILVRILRLHDHGTYTIH